MSFHLKLVFKNPNEEQLTKLFIEKEEVVSVLDQLLNIRKPFHIDGRIITPESVKRFKIQENDYTRESISRFQTIMNRGIHYTAHHNLEYLAFEKGNDVTDSLTHEVTNGRSVQKLVTIFYAWQSDTPSKLNKSFIEGALNAAVKKLHADATLELAERELVVDRDTRGQPGSPPIAATILKKIDQCTVFVGDLTFVGESLSVLKKQDESKRHFPNPNVLLEYGYALKAHGHERIVAVMNTGFGPLSSQRDYLPFDLKHLRGPIEYGLKPDATDLEISQARDGLVKEFVLRLRPCILAR